MATKQWQDSRVQVTGVLTFLDVLFCCARPNAERHHRLSGPVMLVTTNSTRGYNSRGCHSTSATARLGLDDRDV